jgi:hypothetical protein
VIEIKGTLQALVAVAGSLPGLLHKASLITITKLTLPEMTNN